MEINNIGRITFAAIQKNTKKKRTNTLLYVLLNKTVEKALLTYIHKK